MRRWIFAALVLANIGLLMWGLQYLEPQRSSAVSAPEEINPERMRLVSEVPAGKLATRPKPPPPPPPTPITEGPACYRLGPVMDPVQASRMETRLGAQSLGFTRREEISAHVTGYRVFLPSLASREEAERRRRELTRLGFRDHALMQEEGFQNAISLGLYTVEVNAQNHLKRLAEKGVRAQMQTVEQKRVAYWFELAPLDTSADLPARLKTLLDGMAGAEVGAIPCPAPIAPATPVPEPTGSG